LPARHAGFPCSGLPAIASRSGEAGVVEQGKDTVCVRLRESAVNKLNHRVGAVN